jgi:hypothetical protein
MGDGNGKASPIHSVMSKFGQATLIRNQNAVARDRAKLAKQAGQKYVVMDPPSTMKASAELRHQNLTDYCAPKTHGGADVDLVREFV